MANLIPEHFVKQFSSNVYHKAQQEASRLRSLIRTEMVNGEEAYFDSYGTAEAQERIGRHSDTTYSEIDHLRRRLTTRDYFWSALVDNVDKLKMIHDPESQYAKAATMAMGRKMDDIIIASMLGTSWAGKEGTVATVLPNSQKLAAFDGAAFSGLNVQTLRAIKKKFSQNEIMGEQINLVVSAKEIDDLLGQTEVTSVDYNVIKTLVNGEVNQFMGINFVSLERLPLLGASIAFDPANGSVGAGGGTVPVGARRCLAFTSSAGVFGIPSDLTGRVDELPQKHFAKQIYAGMSMGGTRLEEEKVMEVFTVA